NGSRGPTVPEYEATAYRLALRFPAGQLVAAEVCPGEPVPTDCYGRPVRGQIVEGPWADAISAYAGRPLRLVKTDEPGAGVDRELGPVSILSDASLNELARNTERDGVDARRFRMLIGVAGCAPHEEDEWVGRLVRLGEAVVRVHEQVARCAIMTQNPETGVPDFDTLREIARYRGTRDEDGKYVDFGVFGSVAKQGRVGVGDPVEPL